MKKMFHTIQPLFRIGRMMTVGSLLLVLFSCSIREDREDCDPDPADVVGAGDEYEITFRYYYHNNGGDLFAEQVNSLDLFIYNEDGKLVRHVTEQGPFRAGHTVRLDLEPKAYGIYCWGNLSDDVVIENDAQGVEYARLRLVEDAGYDGKVVAHRLERLFHGMIDADLTKSVRQDTVYLMNDTKYITVRTHLREADDAPCSMGHNREIEVFIMDDDTEYRFDNSITETASYFRYTPYISTTDDGNLERDDDNMLLTELSTLRLMIDHNARLVVEREEEADPLELFNDNLIAEILMQHPLIQTQEDLDKEEEYLIDLFLWCDGSGVYANTEITVAGWKVVIEQTGIGY